MYRLIIFGAGSGSEKVKKVLDMSKCEIMAYLDNSENKQGKYIDGKPILHPRETINLEFDYVIIASQHHESMRKQLIIEYKVPDSKIIYKLSDIRKYDFNNYYMQQHKLENKSFTIISDDCCGAYVYNLLGLKYSSPFIWTWINEADYIKMLKNLKYYLSYSLKFIDKDGVDYPVAMLDDIEILFMHNKDKIEAEEKWNERLMRIDYDNLYVKFTCDNEKYIKEYENLNIKNKVCFTYKEHPNMKSCIWLKEFKDKAVTCEENALTTFYNYFDFSDWLSGGTGRNENGL